MASTHGQDSSENAEVEKNKLSLQVDRVVGLIETCCTVHVMSKTEAATYLFLANDIEPTITETVWNELERQNPEFFKDYKTKRVVKKQIEMLNILLYQIQAMDSNLHSVTPDPICSASTAGMPHEMSGVADSHVHNPAYYIQTYKDILQGDEYYYFYNVSTSTHVNGNNIVDDPMMDTSAANHNEMNGVANNGPLYDTTCSTSTQVINPNHMQCDTVASTSCIYHLISENQGVRYINNSDFAFIMDPSTTRYHGMNTSSRMPHGMNSLATHFSMKQEYVTPEHDHYL